MAQDFALGKWIREKFRSQVKFAEKVGAHPTMVSRWMGGGGISEDYERAIRKLGYQGPMPAQEAQDAAAGGPAPYVTREEMAELRGRLEARIEALERAGEKLGEAVRLLLQEREESRQAGRR